MKKLALGVVVGLACTSCMYQWMSMDVRGYSDPYISYDKYERFAVVPASEDHPLLEKQLLRLVEIELEADSFVLDKDNPDFLVMVRFYNGAYSYYKPPTTIPFPVYTPAKTKSTYGWIGGSRVSLTETEGAQTSWSSVQVGGGTRIGYYRNIQLLFVDARKLMSDSMIQLIFTGEADSQGKSSDLLEVAPVMIDEIIKEFPERSGQGAKRKRHSWWQYKPGT